MINIFEKKNLKKFIRLKIKNTNKFSNINKSCYQFASLEFSCKIVKLNYKYNEHVKKIILIMMFYTNFTLYSYA